MDTKIIVKPIFYLFLLLAFLAGLYFYVFNSKTPYMEYMENMVENFESHGDHSDGPTIAGPTIAGAGPTIAAGVTTVPTGKTITMDGINVSVTSFPDNRPQYEPNREQPGPGSPRNTDAIVKDASRENGYNTNMYAGIDPDGQYNGVYTNLDLLHDSTSFSKLSENPMDDNWGGVLYTKQAVDSGKYDDNMVLPYGFNKEKGFGISTKVQGSKSVFA